MTRKDYILIASAVRRARMQSNDNHCTGQITENRVVNESIDLIVEELCGVLHRNNPNFNEDMFAEACHYKRALTS